jgi:hypothetical protein
MSILLSIFFSSFQSQLTCSVDAVIGCYTDLTPFADTRVFYYGPYYPVANSLESCAVLCTLYNANLSGVENGTLCYCGHAMNPQANATKVAPVILFAF